MEVPPLSRARAREDGKSWVLMGTEGPDSTISSPSQDSREAGVRAELQREAQRWQLRAPCCPHGAFISPSFM